MKRRRKKNEERKKRTSNRNGRELGKGSVNGVNMAKMHYIPVYKDLTDI